MQRHESQDNDSSHYMQLYFYNLTFALEQCITRNPQLNLDFLRQLTKTLYVCNSFTNIYKTAA